MCRRGRVRQVRAGTTGYLPDCTFPLLGYAQYVLGLISVLFALPRLPLCLFKLTHCPRGSLLNNCILYARFLGERLCGSRSALDLLILPVSVSTWPPTPDRWAASYLSR